MDLNRILLVFNVRSVVSAWSILTVHSQTELGLNIYVAVSDVRDDVTKTHTVVADTHAVVSDIRRKMMGSQEGADERRRSVSDIQTRPTTKYVLTVAQDQTRSAISAANESNILYFHLVYLANHLPRCRGPVSDVTS